jgi:type IV pilus assembly protein PilM
MFKKKATKKDHSGVFAAVTLHSSGLRYLELSGHTGAFKVTRQAVIPVSRAVNADSIASLLSREVGIMNIPVVFGLPMRDCMIRVIEYPRMPMEDALKALQFDFDRHFTWSYSECTVDVCEVESPLTSSRDNMSMLVAASRNEHISKILQIADRVNIELKAIEPMNVAVLRAIIGPISRKEAWYSIYSDAEGIHFAFVDKNNGLFYRSSPVGINGILDTRNEEEFTRAVSEIQRTISFVANQFKGISADLVVLSGAIATNLDVIKEIEGFIELKVETINVYEQCGISPADAASLGVGFEPALGLCMF